MVMSGFEVRFSRPDEWLRELKRDAGDNAITDGIVRLAVTWSQAEVCDINPHLPSDHRPLSSGIRTRWVQAAYVARGQMVKLSGACGVAGASTMFGTSEAEREKWRVLTLESEERERDLISTLIRGIQETGVDLRTGGLHGEDPNWHARYEDEINAVQVAHNCATCQAPIYFANEIFRHKYAAQEPYIGALDDETFGELITLAGRDDVFIETECPTCQGTRFVEDPRRRGPDKMIRCSACETSPGKRRRLHHLADPVVRDRKV